MGLDRMDEFQKPLTFLLFAECQRSPKLAYEQRLACPCRDTADGLDEVRRGFCLGRVVNVSSSTYPLR